jgi:probable F420-dependent oxidoreductase
MVSIVSPGELAFGIQLPVQAQSTMFAEDWESTAGPAELAALAQAADRSGFLYVAVCDHVAIPQALAGAMGTTWYDTVATLGWLAALTTQTRLLSHVFNLSYRHPLVTAKSFSTLDVLSGGRVILGVGAGHAVGEFEALDVPFADRGALTDAAMDVIDAALRTEFPAVSSGPHTLTGDVGIAPRPVQQPRPPIWVGGSSPAAVRRTARKADGWLPQGTPFDGMAPLIELLLKERDAAGITDPVDIGAITDWIYVGTPSWDVDRPCISGSPEAIAEKLRAYRGIGVDHLQVRFPSRTVDELVAQIEEFGTTVGPLLKS